jgi:hypothetical protein
MKSELWQLCYRLNDNETNLSPSGSTHHISNIPGIPCHNSTIFTHDTETAHFIFTTTLLDATDISYRLKIWRYVYTVSPSNFKVQHGVTGKNWGCLLSISQTSSPTNLVLLKAADNLRSSLKSKMQFSSCIKSADLLLHCLFRALWQSN